MNNAIVILVIGLLLIYLAGTGKLYPLVKLIFLDTRSVTGTDKKAR